MKGNQNGEPYQHQRKSRFEEEKKSDDIDSTHGPVIRPVSTAHHSSTSGIAGERQLYSESNQSSDGDPVSPHAFAQSEKTLLGGIKRSPSRSFSWFAFVLRTLILDFPLFVLLISYSVFEWTRHVHDEYLQLQLEDVFFSDEREESDMTYFTRICTTEDLSTTNSSDLFLPDDATQDDAYQHQLLHGFTIFPGVLCNDTATRLRDYVTSRNPKLSDEEKIFVIAGENRYSFGLGTEEPSVAKAVMEIASNQLLRPSLEKILGPSPALIEMTAITVSYGAVAQHWHDDVISTASAINYAQAFGPSYSVFIQLQDTTKQMGATSVCPGTHYCSDGPMAEICQQEGFQLVRDDGMWHSGDALLMNMNSWHRGAAHSDPNGPDRVMLILTFVPRPASRAETRQMSQGITFSLRWDMWGHTLDDLATADRSMTQPWATLRSLGLYKPAGATWGIDYISGVSMRMSNNDNGFRRNELDTFLERGGFRWLPSFLHGKVDTSDDTDEGWHQFLLRTHKLVSDCLRKITIGFICFYVLVCVVVAFFSTDQLTALAKDSSRFFILVAIIGLLYRTAKRHVDETGWAKDIKAHRRYASTSPSEVHFHRGGYAPTTLPTRYDVLVETRYGREDLAMYNEFINGHPGNRLFLNLAQSASWTLSDYPSDLQERSANNVLETVTHENGRFLRQLPSGAWYEMSRTASLEFIKKQLLVHSSPTRKFLKEQLDFLRGELKYGVLRDTTLAYNDGFEYLQSLETKLLYKDLKVSKQKNLLNNLPSQSSFGLHFDPSNSLPKYKSHKRHFRYEAVRRTIKYETNELLETSWLNEGDEAEGLVDDHWYVGTITHISAQGKYDMRMLYDEDDEVTVDSYTVRPFKPYKRGERVEVLLDEQVNDGDEETPEDYYPATIVAALEDGTYACLTEGSQAYVEDLTQARLRRYPGELKQ